jgi:hypothetical protein
MRKSECLVLAAIVLFAFLAGHSALAGNLIVNITAGSDDARENVTNGLAKLTSTSLDLVVNPDPTKGPQYVGFRFNSIGIPHGATITSANIQFTSFLATGGVANITIKGEASDNAATYTTNDYTISARPVTTASVSWNPPDWPSANAAGTDQRTPDLSSIVQEVVGRTNWVSGNSIALVLTGTGDRVVWSFEGGVLSNTAALNINWTTGGGGAGPHGVPVSWLQAKGLTNYADTAAAEIDDPDHDGMATWKEYYAGTDPTNSNSVFKVTGISYGPTISWYGSTNNGVSTPFHMYRCTNLVTGAWQLLGASISRGSSTANNWSDPSPPSGETAFYRPVVSTN